MNFFKTCFGMTSRDNQTPTQTNKPLNQSRQSSTNLQPQIPAKNNPQNVIASQQPKLPQTSPNQIISPQTTIKIKIRILNSLQKEVIVDRNMTGQMLKKYIWQNMSKQLDVNQMTLYYEGAKFTKNMKLGQLNIVVGNQITIRQSKLDISQVPNIIADVHGQDPITGEKGVAKMKCGHYIGTNCMTALVRSLISQYKYQIRCPNQDDDGQICRVAWSFKLCKKIGVFTKAEITQFEEGLSMNWIKQFTKQCPKCRMTISKHGLKTNRVKCPSCNSQDFCYMCLNKWKGSNNEFCGNQECKFINDFLLKAPWNKKFNLRVKNQNNVVKQFLTPQYRACPHCRNIIEHKEACKHMPCTSCLKSFCWVCLSVKDKNWPCGSYSDYCGKVAQLQKFNAG